MDNQGVMLDLWIKLSATIVYFILKYKCDLTGTVSLYSVCSQMLFIGILKETSSMHCMISVCAMCVMH